MTTNYCFSQSELTASREERTYRNSNKKCIKGEYRTRLLEDLLKRRLGLKEVEEFIIRDRKTFHGGGEDRNYFKNKKKYEEERILVENIMRRKLRESSKHCIGLRKDRHLAEDTLRGILGRNSRVFKKVKGDVKKNSENLRAEPRKKNENKVRFLDKK